MISIDWLTKIIFIPKSYTQFVSSGLFEVRQLDIDQFRLDLREIEAGYPGIVNLRTHTHNTTIEVGGVTLARVVTIINGYTITFEDGAYAVNLVGANSNIADVTNLNTVQIRSSNSAGLTFSDEINNQSFLNRVWINTLGIGLPGTGFPRGTPTSPVDNWSDANIIATSRNFDSYNLDGTLSFSGYTSGVGSGTTTTQTNLNGTNWYSSNPLSSFIIGEGLPILTADVSFRGVGLSGNISGQTFFENCELGGQTSSFGGMPLNLVGFQGAADNCSLAGNIAIAEGSGFEFVVFKDCFSTVAGTGTPTIDFAGMSNSGASFRGYNGGLEILNFGSNNNLSLDINSGNIILDSSCTGGTIVVRGVANLVDNTGSGCTVVTNGLLDPSNLFFSGDTSTQIISDAVWEVFANNPNPGTFGQLLVDAQQTLNVHTEMLKNNSK